MRIQCASGYWVFAALRSSQRRDVRHTLMYMHMHTHRSREAGVHINTSSANPSSHGVPSSFPCCMSITLCFSEKTSSYFHKYIYLLLGSPIYKSSPYPTCCCPTQPPSCGGLIPCCRHPTRLPTRTNWATTPLVPFLVRPDPFGYHHALLPSS